MLHQIRITFELYVHQRQVYDFFFFFKWFNKRSSILSGFIGDYIHGIRGKWVIEAAILVIEIDINFFFKWVNYTVLSSRQDIFSVPIAARGSRKSCGYSLHKCSQEQERQY